jgi:hypothetical protein
MPINKTSPEEWKLWLQGLIRLASTSPSAVCSSKFRVCVCESMPGKPGVVASLPDDKKAQVIDEVTDMLMEAAGNRLERDLLTEISARLKRQMRMLAEREEQDGGQTLR